MNFKVTGTRQRQYKVVENVIVQFLNEIVPMNDLLSTINDESDVDDNVVQKNDDDDVVDDTITIDNTKTEPSIKDDTISMMDDSIIETEPQTDTKLLGKNDNDDDDDETKYADFVNKTSMDLLKSDQKRYLIFL